MLEPSPVETSGVYFGFFITFILSVKPENIRIGTSLNILVTRNSKHKANRYFRARNMLPEKNAAFHWLSFNSGGEVSLLNIYVYVFLISSFFLAGTRRWLKGHQKFRNHVLSESRMLKEDCI